jgi:hypothetical protein
MATPNEPPTERKKVAVDVATPISRGADVVLHDEHEHLHDEADADADDGHVHRREPRRGSDAEPRQQVHADDEHARARDREDLVAADAVISGRTRSRRRAARHQRQQA